MTTEHLEILCKLQMEKIELLHSELQQYKKIDPVKQQEKKEYNKKYYDQSKLKAT
jgi:hypothetical protein